MKTIIIGKIIKPQGIKGEIKVLPIADSPDVFTSLGKVYIDSAEYKIISSRIADGVYLVLRGIADRNSAELLRDKLIYADREDIILPENRWFVADILGCSVFFEDGAELGKVTDITRRGSTDVYTVADTRGVSVSFPFLKRILSSLGSP